jgi:hypothetical protein
MAYTFSKAANPMAIAEQEYSIEHQEIRFTKFTSCIGLIPRRGNQVGGVHLVIMSKDDSPFDTDAADRAVRLIEPYDRVVVIGETDFWEDNVGPAYRHLLSLLQHNTVISVGDGVYGGRIHHEMFQVYENGNYRVV